MAVAERDYDAPRFRRGRRSARDQLRAQKRTRMDDGYRFSGAVRFAREDHQLRETRFVLISESAVRVMDVVQPRVDMPNLTVCEHPGKHAAILVVAAARRIVRLPPT